MAVTSPSTPSESSPKFELVGPKVDDDIRRAIMRYGKDEVVAAVKRQTTGKRGRKPEKDWPELREWIEADAKDWLEGGDPFSTRSNYSIAKQFADKNPGHSYPATMQRIERKLAKNRAWFTYARAMELSRNGYPHSTHIRALEALADLDTHPVWARVLEGARSEVIDYEARNGAPPPAHLSMAEVEEAARNALLTLPIPPKPVGLGGMFGGLASYKPPSGGGK